MSRHLKSLMNYQKIYYSLIDRAKARELLGYKERHHIVPKCMGGSDDISNLVYLTPEEHYVAHQLLVRIHNDNSLLVKAAIMMTVGRPSNKIYGWLRKKFSASMSVSQSGAGNSQYQTKWISNPETRQNKKISCTSELPEGWSYGRNSWVKQAREDAIKDKKNKKAQKQVSIYREYYKIYQRVGFSEFVKITGYPYSKANLVQMFAKLLEEFIPQNGKKR